MEKEFPYFIKLFIISLTYSFNLSFDIFLSTISVILKFASRLSLCHAFPSLLRSHLPITTLDFFTVSNFLLFNTQIRVTIFRESVNGREAGFDHLILQARFPPPAAAKRYRSFNFESSMISIPKEVWIFHRVMTFDLKENFQRNRDLPSSFSFSSPSPNSWICEAWGLVFDVIVLKRLIWSWERFKEGRLVTSMTLNEARFVISFDFETLKKFDLYK